MKKHLTLACLILIIYSSFISGQSAKQYFKAGKDFMSTRNYKDGIEQFSKAIELSPNYAEAYIERANAYEQINEISKAADDYNRAIVFENKSPEIFYGAARVNYKLGNFKEAKNYINKSLELRSKYLEAIQLQVKILLALDEDLNALTAAKKALILKDNAYNHYFHGIVSEKLKNYNQAEIDYQKAIAKNKKFVEPYIALANLRLTLNKFNQAIENCNTAISLDPNNTDAYLVRSKVYIKMMEYPKAIDDISKNIVIDPDNKEMYIIRGTYYQEYAQHQNAINDFSKAILMDEKCSEAYYKRAYSYEQIANYKAAIKDYETLSKLSEYDVNAKKLLDSAKDRLFELNREDNKPVIVLVNPEPIDELVVRIAKDKNEVTIKGKIIDESEIKSLKINNKDVPFLQSDDGYEFLANINLAGKDMFTVSAVDCYDNMQNNTYTVERTEINPPKISIIAPYASDDGEIYLDNEDPNVYVEGKITDESLIKTILIDGVSASFKLDELNPRFSATLNITNKNKFTVRAIDVNNNETQQAFNLNREGVSLLANNPMGRTWVIFIENSNYETFPSLEGPSKDVTLMRSALSNYDVHKVIHKKDLTKKEMEKFFSIELRDLVRGNRVNALLIWYAGHGKFINETGYWIPVDAKRDDEFTYFNINALRASLQSYTNYVTHTLVVTDACESGPTFYQAMREIPKKRNCNDWEATRLKSSQVFSSAGYELAIDNSQFTRTFANTLANNPNACIPIESIVNKVVIAVEKNNQQKPKFGKIAGLEDENGTFFFISKN
jgi:tetratricopeptide (TPR) repeat protein